MHDEFPTAHHVTHGLIKRHAVLQIHRMPPLAQIRSERHSSHQRFIISCNKLHATREIKSSAVDFSDVLNIGKSHRTFGVNMLRNVSIPSYVLKPHVFHFGLQKQCLALPADPLY